MMPDGLARSRRSANQSPLARPAALAHLAGMSQRPKAFLLHGFLGVGKTHLARRLEAKHRAVRFTHDELMRRLYGDDPPAERFLDDAARVFGTMEAVWTRCLDLGTNVVLDFGFWSVAERTRARALVTAHGGEPLLYRLSCPDAVALARIAQRNGQPDSLTITPETYWTLRARFEPLEQDELRIDVAPSEQ
jgi:predicted kinase